MKILGLFLLQLVLAGCCMSGCASSVVRRPRPEQTFRVSGYVLDSVSCRPVAGVYVNIDNEENAFGMPQTDEQGHFVLELLPESRAKATRVTVNTVLYEGWAPLSAVAGPEVVVLLHRNKQHQPIAECAGTVDSLHTSPYASRAALGPGYELAFRLQSSSLSIPDTVRTILLNANQLGFNQRWAWYRLRAYLPNGAGQGPGTDVLTENVRVDLSQTDATAMDKRGYYAFDVHEYHITVPHQGIFIAVQGIVAEGYPISFFPTRHYVPTGRLLQLACPANAGDIWLHARSWQPVPVAQIPFPLYRQAIQVELVGQQ